MSSKTTNEGKIKVTPLRVWTEKEFWEQVDAGKISTRFRRPGSTDINDKLSEKDKSFLKSISQGIHRFEEA